MCLISVLKKGTVKYSDEVTEFISNGFHGNPSGSGFMYKKEGTSFVVLKKGYFNLEQLLADIKSADLTIHDELVIHHRIRTSGQENAENTHPFVISSKHEDVIMLSGKTDKACLAHNGVFYIPQYEKLNFEYSDTYAFSRYIMSNLNVLNLFKEESKVFELLAKDFMGNNKLAILFPDRDAVTYGTFLEDNGYFHSHSGYKNKWLRNSGGVETTVNPNQSGVKTTGSSLKTAINSSSEGRYSRLASKKPAILDSTRNICKPLVYQSKELNPGFRLDGSDIRITEFNYNHFYFSPKNEPLPENPSILYSFDDGFEDFDDSKGMLYNTVFTRHKYGYIKTDREVHTNMWFWPKEEYMKMYTDYMHLQASIGKIGKKGLKKVHKNLMVRFANIYRNPSNYTPLTQCMFKRTSEYINITALLMFYNYWKPEFPGLPEVTIYSITDKQFRKIVCNLGKEIKVSNVEVEAVDSLETDTEDMCMIGYGHD